MRKILAVAIFVCSLTIIGYLVIFKIVVPRAASAFIPTRWQNVPLGQPKTVMHHYLGDPDTTINGKEYWEHEVTASKKYVLDVAYRYDSVSASYRVNYKIEWLGLEKLTELKSGTLGK
jgi:hypothetical protein